MKKLLFISVLMALFCACSNDFDSIEESDSSAIKKKTEFMDSGVLTIYYQGYNDMGTTNFYSAIVQVRVRMWNPYTREYYYILDDVITLCGSTDEPTTDIEYSFPTNHSGWFPEVTIIGMLDRNGNAINVPSSKMFWLRCDSAGELDQAELKVGETYSTHCLSPDIEIRLKE